MGLISAFTNSQSISLQLAKQKAGRNMLETMRGAKEHAHGSAVLCLEAASWNSTVLALLHHSLFH